MDAFFQMDIFFIVTTAVVLVVGTLIAAALFYLVRLLKTLERIAREVEWEARALIGDIDDVRAKVRSEGLKAAHLASFLGKVGKRLVLKSR